MPDLLTGFKGHLALRSKGLLSEHSYRYGQYLQIIRQSSKPFLEINDISPDFPEIINTAIPVFQKIGILLYFPDIIPNKIFNKPQILLDLLYIKVLSPELLRKRKFTITRIQITKSIKGNQLNLNTKELIRLLDFYNLVFRIPNNRDVFYIPQYMQEPSIENKRLIKDAYQINNIIIKSDHFLMNLAMLKLYSQFGKYAELDLNSNYLFWKDAIIIEKNRQKLFIRFNRDNERIELYPWNKGENFDLQNEVVQFIINSRRRIRQGYDYSPKWESGNFDIEVSNDGLYFVKWDKLIEKSKIKANEIEEFIIDKNEKLPEIRVSSISDYKKYIPQKMKLKKSIFICYSHEDIRFKNDLKIYLATLLQKGLISIWDDAELRAGDDWNNKIRNYLTKADICILLVSQNLITSQYVNEVELKLILDNKAKDNCKIIPVLIRPCDWKNWEVYPDKITDDILSNSSANYSIGKFQFLPLNERRELKPVSRWSDTGDAWLQVANTVRDFCG